MQNIFWTLWTRKATRVVSRLPGSLYTYRKVGLHRCLKRELCRLSALFLSLTRCSTIPEIGTYAGVSNEDDHLDWILKNNKMLRKLGAFQTFYDALRIACSKYVCRTFHQIATTAIEEVNYDLPKKTKAQLFFNGCA